MSIVSVRRTNEINNGKVSAPPILLWEESCSCILLNHLGPLVYAGPICVLKCGFRHDPACAQWSDIY